MDATPAQVGRYQVQGVIGRGAMGVVLCAHDPRLDRKVAVKLVARELLHGAEGAEFLERFEREARAASRCIHRNIVAVHDCGTEDGQPYLVMEYVAGQGLDTVLKAGRRFAVAEAIGIAQQVLAALEVAHAAGIVHRDIKPGNILLLPDLAVKLTDFGIARLAGSEMTQLGDMVGTPAYMSPEQCRGERVDGRSDLFSLAAVLHELLTGARAFAGANLGAVVQRVMAGAPDPLPPALVAAHPALPAVLGRALEKQAALRFATAAEFIQALAAAMALPAAPLAAAVAEDALATRVAGAPPAARVAAALEPSALEAARQALAPHIGPLAGVLVRRAAAAGGSVDEFWQRLAGHIDNPAERSAFLARRPAGAG